MKRFHLHLVSDATGETINHVARAALAQFEGVEPVEHIWSLVRTQQRIEQVIGAIEANPGVVMFTLVNKKLEEQLQEGCHRLQVPCIPVLDQVIAVLSSHFGLPSRDQPGRQYALDSEYFARIEAMEFVLAHDDGQRPHDLGKADIVLVGVSRTSKTPTCFYLANRGMKAANVPVVPGCPIPTELETLKKPLVVGLTKSAERLVQVRRNRMRMLNQEEVTDYIDPECVKEELSTARRLFAKQGWPVLDVTRRSIEETAATVLQLYHDRVEGEG